MQIEIYSVMYRLVHKYGWNWGLTRGLINRRFGTNYTADELKELYRRGSPWTVSITSTEEPVALWSAA